MLFKEDSHKFSALAGGSVGGSSIGDGLQEK